MPIKIHHGAPGSYKTSGSIGDDLIVAVLQGRTIITNVRGIASIETIRKVARDAVRMRRWLIVRRYKYLAQFAKSDKADQAELISIDTSTQAGRDRLAVWWHWAPPGAFLQLDEVQRIWPPKMTPTQYGKLTLSEGVAEAMPSGEERPSTFESAFDMHRHGNWDLVLATPSIDKVHPIIRGASESAYKHTNLKTIGLAGWYRENYHMAENTGRTQGDVLQTRLRKVPQWVFGLYESTATGEVRDTGFGANLFKSPKLVAIFSVLAICIIWTVLNVTKRVSNANDPDTASGLFGSARNADRQGDHLGADSNPVRPHSQAAGARPAGDVDDGPRPAPRVQTPLEGYELTLSGWAWDQAEFAAERKKQRLTLRQNDLEALGYTVAKVSACVVNLTFEDQERLVFGCQQLDDDHGFSQAAFDNAAPTL